MDELSDIEARREANAENLRRAFGAPVGSAPPAFAVLLERLAARRESSREHLPDRASDRARGAVLAGGATRAAWPRPLSET
jgi:hypothetical protein